VSDGRGRKPMGHVAAAVRLSALSARAKELALNMGAEAVVLVALFPNEEGDGWDAEHSAFLQKCHGLDWEIVTKVVVDAAKDMVTEPVIEESEPS